MNGLPDGLNYAEFRRRIKEPPEPRTDREFRCSECQARCTRLTDGRHEAGHRPTCSRFERGELGETVGVALWAAAVAWWGVGDFASTHIVMAVYPPAYESTPLVADVIEHTGWVGHLLFKIAILGSLHVHWQTSARLPGGEYLRHAIPLGLAGAGLWLTLTNLALLY